MSVSADPLDLSDCDKLYSQRGAQLIPAAQCYLKTMSPSASEADRRKITERAFIALSAAVNDGPKTAAEADAIVQGLKLVGDLEKSAPGSADLAYWRAVFVSFDAMRKDRGSPLPTNLFKVLKSIQQDLRSAMTLDASLHLQGPNRVLGIMHTQMPGIVGGDKALAETLLQEAYQKAPELSANQIAYARILSIRGKTDPAKSVLSRFLALSDRELDPYPQEPLRSVKPELERDRKAARTLLDELNSEE